MSLQLVQEKEIRPHTVIIRVAPGGAAQVMLYDGQGYRLASNGDTLRTSVQEQAGHLPAGDYTCPLDISILAQFSA